jgi:hypothetical protein
MYRRQTKYMNFGDMEMKNGMKGKNKKTAVKGKNKNNLIYTDLHG